jgi:hypothetical protein
MIVDLQKNEGIWFDLPDGGRVKLRAPSVDDYIRIAKECTVNKPFLHEEPGKIPRVLNHEIPDPDKQARLINDCIILAWEGLLDRNKTEIPCTSENKTALMRLESPLFRDFVKEKLEALGKAAEAAKEEEAKN